MKKVENALEFAKGDDNIRDVTHTSFFRKINVLAKWKVPII